MEPRLKQYLKQFPNFLSIFIFAIFMLVPTSILLEISKSFKTSPQEINYVFTFFNIGNIVGRLTAFLYNTRLSNLKIMIASFTLLGILDMVIVFYNSLIILYLVYALSGYLIGVVYLQANKNLMESGIKDKARLANIAFCFYAVGASLGPLVASAVVENGYSWKYIYVFILPLLVVTIFLFIFFNRRGSEASENKAEVIYPTQIFKNKANNFAYVIIVLLIITYCISEAIIICWGPTFLRVERLFSPQSTSLALSVFWLSVIGGRILISIFTGKLDKHKIMLFISITGFFSVLFFTILSDRYLIFIFIILAGLSYSGLFPLLVSSGSEIFDRGKGLILTIIFTASSIGKAVTPYLIDMTSTISMFLSIFLAVIFMALTVFLLAILLFLKWIP